MSVTQFGRSYKLTLNNLKTKQAYIFENDLRITFRGMCSVKANAGKAKIEIYNLSEKTRQGIDVKNNKDGTPNLFIELEAGYQDQNEMVVRGKALAYNTWRPPNVVTCIEVSDGAFEIATSIFNNKYKKGDSYDNVIDALLDSIGLEKGNVEKIGASLPQNEAFKGRPHKILQRLGSDLGFRYIVQNSRSNIVRSVSKVQSTVLLSVQTGLLSKPYIRGNYIIVQCLLNPNIRINEYVTLSHNDFALDGSYRVLEIKYQGDNFTNKWNMTVTMSIEDQRVLLKEIIDDIGGPTFV